MKKITLAIAFFALAMAAGAQDIVTISGTVVDAKNGQPLPYCNCFLKHSNSGTSTGAEGVFSLKLKNTLLPDTLVIQFIGYESAEFPLAKKDKDLGKIQLKPRDTELKEITVKGKPFDWKKTLQSVLDNCFYKAYSSPYLATTYYKEASGYNNEEIVEVALDVLFLAKAKRRFNRNWIIFGNCGQSDESFFVKGLRKTDKGKINPHPEKSHNYMGWFDCNGLTYLLNGNVYLYRNSFFEKAIDKADFTLTKVDTIDGNKVYTLAGVIREHNSLTELTISFDAEHKTIYSYDLSQTNYTKTEQNSYKVKYNYRIIDGYAVPLYFSNIT